MRFLKPGPSPARVSRVRPSSEAVRMAMLQPAIMPPGGGLEYKIGRGARRLA